MLSPFPLRGLRKARRFDSVVRWRLVMAVAVAMSLPLCAVGSDADSVGIDSATAQTSLFFPPAEFHEVTELKEDTYNSLVKKGIDTTGGRVFHLVFFYYSKEGHDAAQKAAYRKSVEWRPKIVDAAKKLRSSAVMVSAVDLSDPKMKELIRKEGFEESFVVIFTPEGNYEIYEDKPSNLVQYLTGKLRKYLSDDLAKFMPLLVPKQKTYKAFKKDQSLPRVVMILEAKGKSKKKDQLYDAVSSLSIHYHGRLNFGYSKHRKIAKSFGANELPALFLVPAGMKFEAARPYTGTFAYRPLKTWLSQYLGGKDNTPSMLPPPKSVDFIPKINSKDCLDKYCVSRGGVCAIILLPEQSIPEAERGYYLDSMRLVRRALADKLGLTQLNGIHFMWLDSLKFSNWLEKNFGLPGAEYARTVVWYPKKGAWSQYIGRFSPPEVSKWITLASKGKAAAEPMARDIISEFKPNEETSDPEECSDLSNPLPDEVLPDGLRERLKDRKQSSSSSSKREPSHPKMEAYNSKRLPRPRSKAGKSYELNSTLFETNVLESPSHWLVWFQKNSPSEDETSAWTAAARSLKGMVQFGTVSPDERKAVMEKFSFADDKNDFLVRLFPAKHLWSEGAESKAEESSWIDTPLESAKLTEMALGLLSESAGIYMIDSSDPKHSIETWMQSNPTAPRMVLFPSKDLDDPPYLLKALKIEFGHIIEFGMARKSDEALAKNFQIQKFPSLIILAAQGPPGSDGKVQLGLIPYAGHISFNAIAIYLESNIRVAPPEMKKSKDEL